MLKITNHSENYDGIISIDGTDIANINGNFSSAGVYLNIYVFNSELATMNKNVVGEEIGEFTKTILNNNANISQITTDPVPEPSGDDAASDVNADENYE